MAVSECERERKEEQKERGNIYPTPMDMES